MLASIDLARLGLRGLERFNLRMHRETTLDGWQDLEAA
jgi:hypothetical protein